MSNHFYRLKVNINGFKIEDVKVSLEDVSKTSGKENSKARIKISANRSAKTESHEHGDENTSISKEYTKYHELSAATIQKYQINLASMKYYVEEKGSNNSTNTNSSSSNSSSSNNNLVVEFAANATENFYATLDDSCESLVELAARSLLNVKSLENLREVIQDPFKNKLSHDLVDMFSPNLIRDLSLATTTTFTPIRIESDRLGNKKMQMEIALPRTLRTGTLAEGAASSKKQVNYVDASHNGDNMNRVNLRVDGLKLFLEAVTASDDTTSTYTKQFKLPRGVDVDKMSYRIDDQKHALLVEAPIKI